MRGRFRKIGFRPQRFSQGDAPSAAARQLVLAVRGEEQKPHGLLAVELAGPRGILRRKPPQGGVAFIEIRRFVVEQKNGRPALRVDKRGQRVIGQHNGPVHRNIKQFLHLRLKEFHAADTVKLPNRDGSLVLHINRAGAADKQAGNSLAQRIGYSHRHGVQIRAVIHHTDQERLGCFFLPVQSVRSIRLTLSAFDAERGRILHRRPRPARRFDGKVKQAGQQNHNGQHSQTRGSHQRKPAYCRAAVRSSLRPGQDLFPQRAFGPQLSDGSPQQLFSRFHGSIPLSSRFSRSSSLPRWSCTLTVLSLRPSICAISATLYPSI